MWIFAAILQLPYASSNEPHLLRSKQRTCALLGKRRNSVAKKLGRSKNNNRQAFWRVQSSLFGRWFDWLPILGIFSVESISSQNIPPSSAAWLAQINFKPDRLNEWASYFWGCVHHEDDKSQVHSSFPDSWALTQFPSFPQNAIANSISGYALYLHVYAVVFHIAIMLPVRRAAASIAFEKAHLRFNPTAKTNSIL